MPSLKKFLEATDYQINDGFKFGWDCYGKNSFALDAGNFSCWIELDGYWSASVIYDLETQEVMEINYLSMYDAPEAGRWINPSYLAKVKREAKRRGHTFPQAYDDVEFELLGPRAILTRIAALSKKSKAKKRKPL